MTDRESSASVSSADLVVRLSPVRARQLRVLAWAFLPALALVYYFVLMSGIPPFTRLLILELIYCTPILATVALSYVAYSRAEPAESRFWGYLACANFVLFLCEVLLVWWVALIDPSGPPRVSWPFHVLHAIAASFFIAALFRMTRFASAPASTRLRWAGDIGMSLLVVAVLLAEFYVRPVMSSAGASVSEQVLGVGYALFAVLVAGGTLSILVGFKVDKWRSWDKLVAGALIIYSAAIVMWPMWFATASSGSRNYERGVLDLIQMSGHWLLMAAAVYRLTELGEWEMRPLPALTHPTRRWASLITPAIVLFAVPYIAWNTYRSFGDSAWFTIYAFVFWAITVLALFRSMLINLENTTLFHQSVTDPLTGLHNHRFFYERLDDELARAKRYGDDLSVIVLDLDGFGQLNAEHGHEQGEIMLQKVAQLVASRCAGRCAAARLGGDDFGIIAPETDMFQATVLGRRILDSISIEAGVNPGDLTACAGVATYPRHAETAEGLAREAERALEEAKQSGRDRLVTRSEPSPSSRPAA